ncbi:hypothetical protein BV25DRAFT_1824948 [Artomyces pyxidatus]|uniref:Uncharacterized protein n=1 Tax=Artomyces pyxidatus TaxID=48021 RepID=A0ACB8T463_9AGAM|nr:hypothetical protein BV25DRAFT_1824948 [Artomyces pyxidatus]
MPSGHATPAYPLAYPYGSAHAEGVPPQNGYPSASRNPSYPSQSSHGSSATTTSHPTTPYPSQNGLVQPGSNPRQGYTHSRAFSLQQQGYPVQASYTGQMPSQSPPTSPGGDQVQYPASPQRPFACDMCALCNGPCGKTFTRKDALKRHQVC